MSPAETALSYRDGDTTCRGVYFRPEGGASPLPVVLVIHAWDGLGEEVKDKARRLAATAGCIAFAIDVHGEGRFWTDFAQVNEALGPFMSDRGMLLRRLEAALDVARTIPGADPARMAAVGYCFGGLCALDLARGAREELKAVVSLHGGLATNGIAPPRPMRARVLVLHGEDDPLVPPEQVAAFKQEMNANRVDWQFVSYGHTLHGFTRPDANAPQLGVQYNPVADRRSWQAMLAFLAETLTDTGSN